MTGGPIIHAGHIVKRGKWNVRFDERNVHALCSVCNWRDHVDSAYHDKYVAWYVKKFGGDAWVKLQADSEVVRQFKTFELMEVADKYSRLPNGHSTV